MLFIGLIMVPKQKNNLKKEILDAARSLFLEKGYESTSMRKIANRVGISATTIYLYYKDKADVIHTLHKEGFKLLSNQFKTLQQVEEPFERLKAMGKVYINFALESRDYYEIMFIMKDPMLHLLKREGGAEKWVEGEAAFQSLVNVVQDCKDAGYFKNHEVTPLALLVWANMHGLCALKNNGHLDFIAQKFDQDLDASVLMQESFERYAQIIESI